MMPPAFAADPAADPAAGNGLGQLYSFKDWDIGCDNTRRCEAQGYGSDRDDAPPGGRAALIVRREAGPGQVPVLELLFSQFSENSVVPVAGQVLTVRAGALRFRLPPLTKDQTTSPVPPAQVPALLAAALKAPQLIVSTGQQQWSVSLAGARAALLKMDDLQGRVGTTGALVAPGRRSEADVPAPRPPVVRPAPLPPTTPADLKLEPRLRAALPPAGDDCPDFDPAQALDAPIRLTASGLLVAQSCWRGAYQTGSRLWLVQDRPPFRARRLALPGPDGRDHETLVIESLSGGPTLTLHEAAKGRGIGDCWRSIDWAWTGERLALLEAQESPCRLFEAGGLFIPLWRSQGR